MLLNCGVGETLESPLDFKEIKPVRPKGNQPWIFIGRADAEAPILWPPDVNSWLVGKDPDAGKIWGQEEKGVAENEMVGWHHWLNRNESEQTLGNGEGQRSLVCAVHGVATSWMWLSDWATTTYFWLYWVFVAMHRLSVVAGSRGYSLAVVLGLLIQVAFLVEHRL